MAFGGNGLFQISATNEKAAPVSRSGFDWRVELVARRFGDRPNATGLFLRGGAFFLDGGLRGGEAGDGDAIR